MTVTETTKEWPGFVTVPEAAEILRVSKMTIYRMIHSGEVEAIRVGRSFRIKEASLSSVTKNGTVN